MDEVMDVQTEAQTTISWPDRVVTERLGLVQGCRQGVVKT